MLTNSFKQLQAKLGIAFANPKLLTQAFTHSSYVNEHRSAKHNERLEFLGDAVLELAVSEYLFRTYPHRPEGELTKLRASIVCEPSLNKFAEQLNFGAYLLLGRGEELTGGRTRPALLADVFEAFIGALYLDQGMAAVERFLLSMVFSKVDTGPSVKLQDYKSQLQEKVQQIGLGSVVYQLVEEQGPAHAKRFITDVVIDGLQRGSGSGRTKKESEQRAAAEALKRLSQRP